MLFLLKLFTRLPFVTGPLDVKTANEEGALRTVLPVLINDGSYYMRFCTTTKFGKTRGYYIITIGKLRFTFKESASIEMIENAELKGLRKSLTTPTRSSI